MSAVNLQPGELCDITIKGARYADDHGDVRGFDLAGSDTRVWIPRSPQVQVERRAPKEWPPQPDDVWLDVATSAWFAFRDPRGVLLMQSGDPNSDTRPTPDMVLSTAGPMTLVYRKGWTPVPAVEAKPAEVDKRTATIAGLRALADLIEAQPTLPTPYVQANIYIEHLVKDPDERHAELERIARVLDVEPDSRDKEKWPGQRHRYARKALGGGVSYEAVICDVYPKPESTTDVPPSPPEEVAGPGVAAAGPATAVDFELGPVPDADGDLIATVDACHECETTGQNCLAHPAAGEAGELLEQTEPEITVGSVWRHRRYPGRTVTVVGLTDTEVSQKDSVRTRTSTRASWHRHWALEQTAPAVEQDPDALDQIGVAATDPAEVAGGEQT
jgi:hypothetical protein